MPIIRLGEYPNKNLHSDTNLNIDPYAFFFDIAGKNRKNYTGTVVFSK